MSPDERTPLLKGVKVSNVVRQGVESQVVSTTPTPTATKVIRRVGPDLVRGVLMMLMAIDHTNVSLKAYGHGQGMVSEAPATVITEFNDTIPYILRTLSHLCAPGFALLMGLGLAYWSASRVAQGQGMLQLISYLLGRAAGILLLNELGLIGIVVSGIWLPNLVMWALAIDYVLVGIFNCVLLLYLEPAMVALLTKLGRKETEPDSKRASNRRIAACTVDTSLFALAFVLFWVNVWTADNQGRCTSSQAVLSYLPQMESTAIHTTASSWLDVPPCKVDAGLLYRFFFGQAVCPNLGMISAFPPVGWLGPVVLGLAYGRFLQRAKRSELQAFALNSALAVAFAALFVSTRLLSYGNLSTDCLHTPAQRAHPGSNQYLASWKSFFYMVKYPPSPAYVFGTLSGCFLLLAVLDFAGNHSSPLWDRVKKYLLILGTHASFFYAFHMIVILFAGSLILKTPLAHPLPPGSFADRSAGYGWTFWITWVLLMLVSYHGCKWFERVKMAKGPNSLWRFL